MALKTTGLVIPLETKLLIVGDSVMGCLSGRRGMVTHLPTRVHLLVTALSVRVMSPSRIAPATHRSGLVALLVLSYQLRVLRYPEHYAKTGTFDGRGSALPSAIKLETVLDCQAKILEAAGFSGLT